MIDRGVKPPIPVTKIVFIVVKILSDYYYYYFLLIEMFHYDFITLFNGIVV